MFFFLLFLFTVVPVVEFGLLIWIGTKTSLWFTVALVITTGILGASLARWQGWRTAGRIQSELRSQRMPTDALLDALLILVAGVVLITPGVLTDVFGFSLLVPPIRTIFKRGLVAWFKRNVDVQGGRFTTSFRGLSDDHDDTILGDRSRIIDAKVIEPPDDEKPS